jgi:hypothetical protein
VKSQKKKIEGTKSIDILSEKISDTTTQVSQQETSQELNESTSESKKQEGKKTIPVLKEAENK